MAWVTRSIALVLSCGALSAADLPTFEKTVAPLLTRTCTPCHNDNVASGGVDIAPFTTPESLTKNRDGWEIILRKLRAGEMPPKGIPRPPQMDSAIQYLSAPNLKRPTETSSPIPAASPPAASTAAEYSNTIRDLLAVDFQADKSFPTDDLGYGFDNIGDVLTVSPVLMENYMAAAARIASRAIGADPLPKPLEVAVRRKDKKIRRVDLSTIEAIARVDFDGDYTVRFGLQGERAADAKPVTLALLDGRQAAPFHAGRNQALQARLLRPVFRRADAPLPSRRRSRLPRRLPR